MTLDRTIQQMRELRQKEEQRPSGQPADWHCGTCSQDLSWHKRTADDIERTIGSSAARDWENQHNINP